MPIAVRLSWLAVAIATLSVAGREEIGVPCERGDGRILSGEVGGAVRREDDTVVVGRGAGSPLGGDGTGGIGREPQAAGPHVLANRLALLAVGTRAVAAIRQVVGAGLARGHRERRAAILQVALLPLVMASEEGEGAAIPTIRGRYFDGHWSLLGTLVAGPIGGDDTGGAALCPNYTVTMAYWQVIMVFSYRNHPGGTMAVLTQLRQIRERQGLSQIDLAEKSGVTQTSISHLERGRPARFVTMRKLAAALNVTPAELQNQQEAN